MKCRIDFITNSSSSSYLVLTRKKNFTYETDYINSLIKDEYSYCKKFLSETFLNGLDKKEDKDSVYQEIREIIYSDISWHYFKNDITISEKEINEKVDEVMKEVINLLNDNEIEIYEGNYSDHDGEFNSMLDHDHVFKNDNFIIFAPDEDTLFIYGNAH